MNNVITIAVDAMGGDGSPQKVIKGIQDHHKKSKNIFYRIFGDEKEILKFIPKNLDPNCFEITRIILIIFYSTQIKTYHYYELINKDNLNKIMVI